MRLHLLAPAILCLALAACQNTSSSTQTPAAPVLSMEESRQIVGSICASEEATCNCIADNLNRSLTAKEWAIFRAATQNAETPPEGTTDTDLNSLTDKLSQAGRACSAQ